MRIKVVGRILYESGLFWVGRAKFGSGKKRAQSNGYKVFRHAFTHSVEVKTILADGERGLRQAIAEADRLNTVEAWKSVKNKPEKGEGITPEFLASIGYLGKISQNPKKLTP